MDLNNVTKQQVIRFIYKIVQIRITEEDIKRGRWMIGINENGIEAGSIARDMGEDGHYYSPHVLRINKNGLVEFTVEETTTFDFSKEWQEFIALENSASENIDIL